MNQGVKRNYTGFTLMELMIVVAIAAIMAALAGPSLNRAYQNQQLESAKDLFLRQIRQARLTAMSSGQRVVLCRADINDLNAPANNCIVDTAADSNARYWGSGWIVFLDLNADDQYSDNDVLLQTGSLIAKDVGLYQGTSNGEYGRINYFPNGRGNRPGTFCLADRRYSNTEPDRYIRAIKRDILGRIRDATRAYEETTIGAGDAVSDCSQSICSESQGGGVSVCQSQI